jgi:hypothetical protein
MKIHEGKRIRRQDILEATWMCGVSRSKRIPYYRKCSDLYMYGGDPAVVTRSNKIKPTINRQSSFLYAPHSIKFWLDIPPEEEDPETYDRMDPAADGLGLAWHDSGLGKIFKRAVTWSLVYGATILSILPRLRTDRSVEVVCDWVHPRDFGVWDDGQPELEKQEAFSLTTYKSLPEIRRLLAFHPNRAEVERSLYGGNKDQSGFEGMITTPPNASVFDIEPSFWAWYTKKFDYRPVYTQPQYEWTDTYIFDDDLEDYRICTTTGDFLIWDRPMQDCCVPGLAPFVKVCAEEHPEWFWGVSMADDLSALQMWYAGQMDALDKIIGKVTEPPIALIGVGQTYDEKAAQYRRKKGEITLPQGADIKSFQPDVPQSLFEFIQSIDTQIDEAAGHRPNMMGKGDQHSGKGGDAVQTLVRIAGSEMLSKSYEIEINAEDCAALLFAYGRRYNDAHLIDEKGRRFLLAEFPRDVKTRVDGHSSSPVFAENSFDKAMALKRVGSITDEMLLILSNIPQIGRAMHDLRIIGFQKAIAEQIVKVQQEQKRSGKAEK